MSTSIVKIYQSGSREWVCGATDPMGSKGQQSLLKKKTLFLNLLHRQSIDWMSLFGCCFGAAWEDLHVNLNMLIAKKKKKKGHVVDIFTREISHFVDV